MYRKNNLTETQILSFNHKLEIKFANSTPQKYTGNLVNDLGKTPKGKPVEESSFIYLSQQNININLQQKYNLSLPKNFSIFMPKKSPQIAASKFMPH